MNVLQRIIRDRAGQDMIEYALMAATVCVAVAAFIPYSVVPALIAIYSRLAEVTKTLTGVG